jgi:hypothetical protein
VSDQRRLSRSANWVVSLLGLLVSASSADRPWRDPVSIADWRVKAKPSVLERGFTKKDMAQFLDNWRDTDSSRQFIVA